MKKFLSLICMTLIMCACVLSGCSLFGNDPKAYYDQIVAQVTLTNGMVVEISMRELIYGYNTYGSEYTSSGSNVEEAVDKVITDLINKKAFLASSQAKSYALTPSEQNQILVDVYKAINDQIATYEKEYMTEEGIKAEDFQTEESEKGVVYEEYEEAIKLNDQGEFEKTNKTETKEVANPGEFAFTSMAEEKVKNEGLKRYFKTLRESARVTGEENLSNDALLKAEIKSRHLASEQIVGLALDFLRGAEDLDHLIRLGTVNPCANGVDRIVMRGNAALDTETLALDQHSRRRGIHHRHIVIAKLADGHHLSPDIAGLALIELIPVFPLRVQIQRRNVQPFCFFQGTHQFGIIPFLIDGLTPNLCSCVGIAPCIGGITGATVCVGFQAEVDHAIELGRCHGIVFHELIDIRSQRRSFRITDTTQVHVVALHEVNGSVDDRLDHQGMAVTAAQNRGTLFKANQNVVSIFRAVLGDLIQGRLQGVNPA